MKVFAALLIFCGHFTDVFGEEMARLHPEVYEAAVKFSAFSYLWVFFDFLRPFVSSSVILDIRTENDRHSMTIFGGTDVFRNITSLLSLTVGTKPFRQRHGSKKWFKTFWRFVEIALFSWITRNFRLAGISTWFRTLTASPQFWRRKLHRLIILKIPFCSDSVSEHDLW